MFETIYIAPSSRTCAQKQRRSVAIWCQMSKRGAFEGWIHKISVSAAKDTARRADVATHIESGFNTRDRKDVKIVCMQSNDGHGVSSVALRLSASSPKAARAMQSCVNRSENTVREGDKQKGEGASAYRKRTRTNLRTNERYHFTGFDSVSPLSTSRRWAECSSNNAIMGLNTNSSNR